jgi:signal transduction histidine kinase
VDLKGPVEAMADYKEGIKKEVAEIKFLIHDLRVERFINEVIHFHVTLNTDLEIYSMEQAQILHGHDLQVLKTKAVSLRKAFQEYSNAVKNFSPDRTILRTGKDYIETIRSTCALILNPLWGRADDVLSFLPPDSRSARSHKHYKNCIHWIGGVSQRIEHFLEEQRSQGIYEEFDLGAEVEQFTRDVIRGYVTEASDAAVDLQLGRLDPVLVGGNRYRFRRMLFNMVMNSVDALAGRRPGLIQISDTVGRDIVDLRVHDNGVGMSPTKIDQVLRDKDTLDGELHSLGFVFVRQTIAEFGANLSIESDVGEGTTISVSFPVAPSQRPESASPGELGTTDSPLAKPVAEEVGAPPTMERLPVGEPSPASRNEPPVASNDKNRACGRIVYEDYKASEAQYPGCIFAISLTDDDRVDFFTHRAYDRWWNMDHEDLTPMYFEATVRGRLEEDDNKRPLLILKEPRSAREYFEFKNVPEADRDAERHVVMVHDEYVRIARKLIETGLSDEIIVELTGLQKFFPGREDLVKAAPFPLRVLAEQPLSTERQA